MLTYAVSAQVYNIDNSPEQCIMQGLSSNGLTDLPNAIYGTIYGNAAPIAQELVKVSVCVFLY